MNSQLTNFILIFIFLILNMVNGCVSYVKPLEESNCTQWIPSVEDGKTTKEEIIQKYGAPSKTYKNGNILIYYMKLDSDPEKLIKGYYRDNHFVLVFNVDGVLVRHSIVKH